MKSKRFASLLTILFLLGGSPIAKASTISNYTVKSGDSLWKIAQTYNTTVSKLASLNKINPNGYIYVGQTLKVEDNRIIYHTAISGDTLWKISLKYNTTVKALTDVNNLTSSVIYIGQVLRIPSENVVSTTSITTPEIKTVNYKAVTGDTIWGIAQKHGTTVDTIIKSNMLVDPILMPGQIITVPVNTTVIVKPIGISMLTSKKASNFGDIYTWENARRIFTVGQRGTLKDLKTGISFNIKYYGGSNHADIVPLTSGDSTKMKQIYGTWSWSAIRPMILTFNQGGTNYQMAVSLTGLPHSTTDMYPQNWINGHFDMYFYNSTSHNTNEISPTHQKNILTANGQ